MAPTMAATVKCRSSAWTGAEPARRWPRICVVVPNGSRCTIVQLLLFEIEHVENAVATVEVGGGESFHFVELEVPEECAHRLVIRPRRADRVDAGHRVANCEPRLHQLLRDCLAARLGRDA